MFMASFIVSATPGRATDAIAVTLELLEQHHSIVLDCITLGGSQITQEAFLSSLERQEQAASNAVAILALPICSCTEQGEVRVGDAWSELGEPLGLPVVVANELIEHGMTDAGEIKISLLRWELPMVDPPLDIEVRIRNFVEDHEGERLSTS
jgi:hypothetical protein